MSKSEDEKDLVVNEWLLGNVKDLIVHFGQTGGFVNPKCSKLVEEARNTLTRIFEWYAGLKYRSWEHHKQAYNARIYARCIENAKSDQFYRFYSEVLRSN